MNETLATVLGIAGVIISIVSITFVIITFANNRKKDNVNEVKRQSEEMNGISKTLLGVDLKLTQVFNTTTETRADVKALSNEISEHSTQIALMQKDISMLKETKMDK